MVEPGQLCTDAQAKENSTTIPYSSVAHVQFDAAFLADKPRATLLWHRSNCGDATRFYGMHVRTRVVAALRGHNASDVVAACSGERASRFERLATVREMLDSRFCLVLVGDTQSSRRRTEVMLTGCIPVFVGPPWHALPLPGKFRGRRLRCSSRLETSGTNSVSSRAGLAASTPRPAGSVGRPSGRAQTIDLFKAAE